MSWAVANRAAQGRRERRYWEYRRDRGRRDATVRSRSPTTAGLRWRPYVQARGNWESPISISIRYTAATQPIRRARSIGSCPHRDDDSEGDDEMRRMILLAAVAAPLLTASTTAGAQTAAATTPRCTTAALEVWLGVGGGGGQAGSIAYPIEFTNVSGHACHLYGFPGVSAEVAGHRVGSAARRDHAVVPQT